MTYVSYYYIFELEGIIKYFINDLSQETKTHFPVVPAIIASC